MTCREEEEEEVKLFLSSRPLFRSNISKRKNNTQEETSDSHVIFRHCKYAMQTYKLFPILLIFFSTLVVISNCQQHYDSRQQNPEFSPTKLRIKRWTSEVEVTDVQSNRNQQSNSIPAANPNFEAAFQGECGKNNNSNPCEHICLDLHDGTYECSCFYGFALAVDGYSCASLDKSPLSTTSFSTASSTLPPSTRLATLLPTNRQQNKLVQGDLEEKPILNQSKVANLPEVNSRIDTTQRRGLDSKGLFEIYSNSNNNNKEEEEANRNTSDSSTFAEIDQTNSGQESLKFQATEHGRASDSLKLAGELAEGANLKDNEIASQVGGENKKFEADYLKGRRLKVGGVSPDVSVARRRRQRRLLNTAATWIHQKVAEQSTINNQNSDSNYSNNVSGDDDENYNYNDSGPPNEKSYLVQIQQEQRQSTSYQQPATPKVAEQANIIEVSSVREEPSTIRMTITEASSGVAVTSETAARYSNNNNNNNKVEHYINRHWPKYDINAGQQLNKSQFIKFPTHTKEHIEYYRNDNDMLVDSDIESIMISNDKLVKQLEDLVSRQTIGNEDSQEDKALDVHVDVDVDVDVDDKDKDRIDEEQDKTIEVVLEANKYRKIDLGAAHELGKDGQEQGYYRRNRNDKRGANDGSLDYNLNLLEDLVRKTFEDNTQEQKLRERLKQKQEETHLDSRGKHKQSYMMINREVPNQLNRSSLAADEMNGSRARRSSKLLLRLRGSPKSTKKFDASEQTSDYNNNNRRRDEEVDGEEGFNSKESPSLNENRLFDSSSNLERGVLGVDIQNSIKRNINDRLCAVSERDNENNFDYRDCWDLPECESGGKCLTETEWFYNNSNPNLVLQFKTYPRCQCPIGRGGYLCQKPIQRRVPKFSGKSYLALPMIKDSSLSNLHFLFRPLGSSWEQEQTILLLYSEKFLLLLDDLSRVELRYITQDSGSKITRVIGSRDAEINKWNELLITNDASSDESSQTVLNNLISPEILMNRIVLVLPDKIQLQDLTQGDRNKTLSTTTTQSMELFVAGVPDAFRSKGAIKRQHSSLTMDKENLGGFTGCIRELSLNKRVYNFRSDLNGDTLDGFDIGECCMET